MRLCGEGGVISWYVGVADENPWALVRSNNRRVCDGFCSLGGGGVLKVSPSTLLLFEMYSCGVFLSEAEDLPVL
jgi:hypothetical protein